MLSCVLLSAGESRRFGSPKALALIQGVPALVRAQTTLVQSSVDEIVVVLGAHAEAVGLQALKHKKVRIVYNKDYKLGQTSSFSRGLREVNDAASGVMLWPVDCPLVRPETVEILAGAFRDSTREQIIIPTFEGRKGHPPIFPIHLKETFLRLSTEEGLNAVARAHARQTVLYPVKDPGVVQTFNTRAELDSIKKGTEP